MILKLTPEQKAAVRQRNGEMVCLQDEETAKIYVVVDQDVHRQAMEALKKQQDLDAIRRGAADMEAGRVLTLDELDRRVRDGLGLPTRS